MSDPAGFEEIRSGGPSSSSPQRPVTRTRTGTTTSDSPEAPWRQRSSIRIRRLPSQQSIANRGSDERPRSGSGRPASGSGSRDFAPGAANLTVPPLSRPRAGSDARNRLRHETRDLNVEVEGRRRSSSDSTRSWNQTHDNTGAPRRMESYMPNVAEETGRPSMDLGVRPTLAVPAETPGRVGYGRRLSNAMRYPFPSFRPNDFPADEEPPPTREEQYEEDLVDVLDTIGT